MKRITDYLYADQIGFALDLVGPHIRERIAHVDFFTGDPHFAGIHEDDRPEGAWWDFRVNAHCVYPNHTFDAKTTIVLPTLETARFDVVLHEIGHAVHETVDFSYVPPPVTEYAETNGHEAFAEFFENVFAGDISADHLLEADEDTYWLISAMYYGTYPYNGVIHDY